MTVVGLLLLVIVLVTTSSAHAGGLSLYEIATADVGLASGAFSYGLPYGGNLPVNQNRRSLVGAVVSQFLGSYINFFQVSFIWGGGGRTT